MVSFVEIKTDNLQLAPGLKVLKAKDYASYLDSQHLVEAANSKAESIMLMPNKPTKPKNNVVIKMALHKPRLKMRKRWLKP